MTTYLVDGRAPGQFRARCALTLARPEKSLTPEESREAKENGYLRVRRTDLTKPRWDVHFPQCPGIEFTDREAYVDHVQTVHRRRPPAGENGPFAREVARGWKPPRLTPEGKPFVDKDNRTRTCSSCALVAEVDDTNAAELWWDEHLRGCQILAQDAS